MKKAIIVILFVMISGVVKAASIEYAIKGIGSGELNGTSFTDSAFSIDLVGDTSQYDGVAVDPLSSASVTIDGLGTTVLNIATRIGFNSGNNAVFFSRSSGIDLFDFYTSAPVDLTTAFGPISGNNVFAIQQFNDVSSSLGLLSFFSASNVTFSAALPGVSEVPVPAAAFLFGPALLGFLGLRRKTKQTA